MKPFTFTVTVELEREEGKFEARDVLGEQLRDAIEGADPGSVEGDNGGVYAVTSWEVADG